MPVEPHHHPSPEPLELRLLAVTLDAPATLATVAAAFVPALADWGFIHLVDGEGVPRRVAVMHADPGRADLAARFRALPPGPGRATLTAQTIRDRAPRLLPVVTPEVLRWAAHDARHLALLEALAPHSLLAVPLLARSRAVGGITLMRAAAGPPFTEGDLIEARRLALPSALALDNAQAVADAHRPRGLRAGEGGDARW